MHQGMSQHRPAEGEGTASLEITRTPCLRRDPLLSHPHHTISDAGLMGGGHVPMPGEVSLAHNGVRCLDELPECRRQVLEVFWPPPEESIGETQLDTIFRTPLLSWP